MKTKTTFGYNTYSLYSLCYALLRRPAKSISLFLILFFSLQATVQAALVTVGGSTTTDAYASGIVGRFAYSSAASIYTAAEIGGGGMITSFALNKGGGRSRTDIDSVYIFMKETSAIATPDLASVAGYTLVYSGDFPNSAGSGWMSVTLSAPFSYAGTSNLSVLIVRHNGTPLTSSPPSYYGSRAIVVPRSFYYSETDYWTDWGSPTATTADFYTTDYRPQIQLDVEPFPACSGKPVAGMATANGSSCPSAPVVFSLSGTTLSSALTYSWDTAATATGTWGLAGTTTLASGYWSFTPPSSKTLYYRCRVSCGALSDTSTIVDFTTTAPLPLPYLETFESVPAGSNADCAGATVWSEGEVWYTFDVPYDSKRTPGLDNHTAGGSNWLMGGYYVSIPGDRDFWFTPGFELKGGQVYQFSYWYNTDGNLHVDEPFEFGAYIGTEQNAAAMTTAIGRVITPGAPTTYQQYTAEFTPPADGAYYIGIYARSNWDIGFAIDDIGLQEVPPCAGAVVAGTIEATPSKVCAVGDPTMLELKGSTLGTGITYTWQFKTPTTAWTTIGTGKPPFTTPALTESGSFRCIVTCTASGSTDISTEQEVAVGPVIPPYFETFETVAPGANAPCAAATVWSRGDLWYTFGKPVDPSYPGLDNHTPGGTNWLMGGFYVSLDADKDYWFTPALQLTGSQLYQFSYWYNTDGFVDADAPFEFGAYIGTDQDRAAMTTAIGPVITPGSPVTYQEYATEFTVATTGIYYIGIYAKSNFNTGFAIDDIGLQEVLPCTGTVVGGTVAADPISVCTIGGTTNLSLKGSTLATGLTYTWQSKTATTPWVTVGTGKPPFTTPALTERTWFRCLVTCTASGATGMSTELEIAVGPLTPPYLETFESVAPGTNAVCAGATGWRMRELWYTLDRPISSDFPGLDNHTAGGSHWLMGGYHVSLDGPKEFWFTPGLKLKGGQSYQLSYWYNTDGIVSPSAPFEFGAYIGTDQNAAAMTTALGPVVQPGAPVKFQQYAAEFSVPVSGVYYIGIYGKSNFEWGFAIDDIGLQEIPPCASSVTAGTIVANPDHICFGGGTTVLDLKGRTVATGLTYTWQSKTATTAWATAGTAKPPFTTAPLMETTSFRCIMTCTASGATDTSEVIEIGVGNYDLPYTEDFESTTIGSAPLCSDATVWGLTPWEGWRVNALYPYYNHTPGGRNYLLGGYYLGSPEDPSMDNYWFTPGLYLRAGYKYALSFYYIGSDGYNSNLMGVYYGAFQNVSSMTNTILPFREISNSDYERFDTTFTATASGVFHLGFRKSGVDPVSTYSYDGVAFDDISLNYAPCQGSPVAGTLSGSIAPGKGLCAGTPVTLRNTGATFSAVPGLKYQWERRSLAPGAGWFAIDGATDTVISADTLVGYEYRFAVICINSDDTVKTAAFAVPQLAPHPAVSILPLTSPVYYCLGDTVRLTATSFSGGTYEWLRDGVVVSGWAFDDMGATEPGFYTVKVKSALSACPALSAAVELRQNDPGYSVILSKPADSILCDDMAVTLSAAGSKPGLSYQWRRNNVPIPGATGTTCLVNSSGYYRVTASDGISTCAATSRSIKMTIKPTPPAVITLPFGTLTACAEVGVRLDANRGGFSYQWFRAGIPVVGLVDSSVIITHSGVYSVKVRTPDGCASVSSDVKVNILPTPVPVIARSGFGFSTVLGTTAPFITYKWLRTGMTGVTTEGTTSSIGITEKGVYKVVVTDANGCTGESAPLTIMDEELDIPEAPGNTGIKIYPNPTAAKVYIESPVAVRVAVKDVTGKTIYNHSGVKEIDLGQLADGVYLLMISDLDGNRLLKQQRISKVSSK